MEQLTTLSDQDFQRIDAQLTHSLAQLEAERRRERAEVTRLLSQANDKLDRVAAALEAIRWKTSAPSTFEDTFLPFAGPSMLTVLFLTILVLIEALRAR